MGKRMYKMEISVEIDESERQPLIDTAREYYGRSGRVSTVEDDETEVHLTPQEFIETVDDALIELLNQHPGLEQAGRRPAIQRRTYTWRGSVRSVRLRAGSAVRVPFGITFTFAGISAGQNKKAGFPSLKGKTGSDFQLAKTPGLTSRSISALLFGARLCHTSPSHPGSEKIPVV